MWFLSLLYSYISDKTIQHVWLQSEIAIKTCLLDGGTKSDTLYIQYLQEISWLRQSS